MITEQDIKTIHAAIMKNVPPAERATAEAMMNVGLHVINQMERITVAFETIAAAQKPPNNETIIAAIIDAQRRGILKVA